MAKKKKKNKRRLNWWFILLASAVLSAVVLISMQGEVSMPFVPSWEEVGDKMDDFADRFNLPRGDRVLTVHTPNTAGESVLLTYGSHAVLLDAGAAGDGPQLVDALRAAGVQRLDAVLLTQPTPDRLGGMATVLDTFEVGGVYLPTLPEDVSPSDQSYTDFLFAVGRRGLKLTEIKAGDRVALGTLELLALSPTDRFDTLAANALVLRVEYDQTAVLLLGGAGVEAQNAILRENRPLQAQLLVATGTVNESFQAAVSPQTTLTAADKPATVTSDGKQVAVK